MILVSVCSENKTSVIPLQSYSSFWAPLCLDIVPVGDESSNVDTDGDGQLIGQFALLCSNEKEPVGTISKLQSRTIGNLLVWTLVEASRETL